MPMAQDKKTLEQAAAAAMAAAKKLARADARYEETLVRGQYKSECWVHAPFTVDLKAAAVKRLVKVSTLRGGMNMVPEKVHVVLDTETNHLYIYPTAKDDHGGIDLKPNSSSRTFNIREMMYEYNLLIEPGHKVRYAVEYAGADSPVGPALVIDLSLELEKARLPEKKRKSKSKKQNNTNTSAQEPAAKAEKAEPDATKEATSNQ